MGLLFWHCVHGQWTRFDRLSPDKLLIFQLLYHNLYHVQQKMHYKLAVETSQRFRGGGTEIQLGGRGPAWPRERLRSSRLFARCVRMWRSRIGGAKAPSSAALAKISESVSIKIALFSLSMFRYSLHSSTRQNTASIVLFLDPPETTASIPHRIKVSISVNPCVFHELPIKRSLIVLIAAHSWDNIPWDFLGRWKVLRARIDYMMHYYF